MESKINEQNFTSIAGKPKVKSISERLRSLKDKLIHREIPPMSWEEWRRAIIENRQNGILEEKAPERFFVSKSLLNTFQEMLPVRYPGKIDDKLFPDAADIAKKKLEVSRAFVLDESGIRLLVHNRNGGESIATAEGATVARGRAYNELGDLHTHPVDTMPSSIDIALLLSNINNITMFIITPHRVISLFRANQAPLLDPLIVKGYLMAMAKSKGRHLSNSGEWTLTYRDLSELYILGYEAKRGNNVFVRKDNIK